MRIGVLGGSFDPIHNAHLKLARAALKQLRLNKVYLVISPRSPFKKNRIKTNSRYRFEMAKLASKSLRNIHVADWEIQRKGLSYTVDTLRQYRRKHSADDLFLILGSDAYASFQKWRNPEAIKKMCTLVIGRRPGTRIRHPESAAADEGSIKEILRPASIIKNNLRWTQNDTNVVVLKGTFPDISSTRLRRNLVQGKSVRGLLPQAVVKFIKTTGLYQRDSAL